MTTPTAAEGMTPEDLETLRIIIEDAEAMHGFIWAEMAWEDFRDEMLQEGASAENFRYLKAFLERDNNGFRQHIDAAKKVLKEYVS